MDHADLLHRPAADDLLAGHRGRITSWTNEEYVVAEGKVEARTTSADPWTVLDSLGRYLSLPITVPSNRAWNGKMVGESLADLLEEEMDPAGPVKLRIRTEDYHGRTIKSNPLETSSKELEGR